MFKLIRDKIPEIAKSEGKVINYAAVQNKELYYKLLIAKFIEESNEFLESCTAEKLADLKLVLDSLTDYYNDNLVEDGKTIEDIYDEKTEAEGKYENEYIGFFADPTPEKEEKKEGE